MGGGMISAFGQKYAADAARDAAKFNAKIIRRNGLSASAQVRSQARRKQSNNITRVAKSGVRLEGSPLEFLSENIRQTELEAARIDTEAFIKSEFQSLQAKSAQIQGRLGVAASIHGSVDSIVSFGLSSGGGGGGGAAAGGQTFNSPTPATGSGTIPKASGSGRYLY